MLRQNKCSFICCALRNLSTTPRLGANHYDVLGLTPKASQNDIKTAYYNMSKIYHPDISKDEASAKKFRAISEAYEVLGNIKLKKMYDRGMLVGRDSRSRMDYKPEPEPTDPKLKFYKSHAQRHVAPTMDGKVPIYDFDSWSRNHYGKVFNESKKQRATAKYRQVREKELALAIRQEYIMYMVVCIGCLFIMLVLNGTENYDKNSLPNKVDPEKVVIESESVEIQKK